MALDSCPPVSNIDSVNEEHVRSPHLTVRTPLPLRITTIGNPSALMAMPSAESEQQKVTVFSVNEEQDELLQWATFIWPGAGSPPKAA